MELVLQKTIDNILVDGYSDNAEAWFTRTQIGELLEYDDPNRQVARIHNRHKDRLDKLSEVVKLTTTDGKEYDTHVYNIRGIFEICRWSRQPKADAVMDKLYEMAEEVARKGYYTVMPETQLAEILIANMNDKERLEHVIIPAMRESNIDQAIFTAKLTGMTPEEFRNSRVLMNKAIENDDAKSKLRKWRSQSRFVNHVFSADDFPEEYRDRFYMEGLILELSRKKAYRGYFANSYGKMYFNRDGYFALLDVMERRKWITPAEKRSWKREAGLV